MVVAQRLLEVVNAILETLGLAVDAGVLVLERRNGRGQEVTGQIGDLGQFLHGLIGEGDLLVDLALAERPEVLAVVADPLQVVDHMHHGGDFPGRLLGNRLLGQGHQEVRDLLLQNVGQVFFLL